MALRELLTVRSQDHRDVRERGCGHTHRLVDNDLAWRVREVVVPTNDVGYPHHGIIDHGREVVGGCAVRTDDDEIVELAGVEGHAAVNHVTDDDVTAPVRNLDADGMGFPGVDAPLRLGRIYAPAGALIALKGVVALLGGFPVRCEPLGGTEAVVRPALSDKATCDITVDVEASCLPVGAPVATDLGTLVPVEPQPAQGA